MTSRKPVVVIACLLLQGCLLTPNEPIVYGGNHPQTTPQPPPPPANPFGRNQRQTQDPYARQQQAEEQRRQAMAERQRQADQRRINSALQNQALSSCMQAGGDRATCRTLSVLGSVLMP